MKNRITTHLESSRREESKKEMSALLDSVPQEVAAYLVQVAKFKIEMLHQGDQVTLAEFNEACPDFLP